jgi:hypothetical protein
MSTGWLNDRRGSRLPAPPFGRPAFTYNQNAVSLYQRRAPALTYVFAAAELGRAANRDRPGETSR